MEDHCPPLRIVPSLSLSSMLDANQATLTRRTLTRPSQLSASMFGDPLPLKALEVAAYRLRFVTCSRTQLARILDQRYVPVILRSSPVRVLRLIPSVPTYPDAVIQLLAHGARVERVPISFAHSKSAAHRIIARHEGDKCHIRKASECLSSQG